MNAISHPSARVLGEPERALGHNDEASASGVADRSAWYVPPPEAVAASQWTAFTRALSVAAGREFDDPHALHRHTVAEFRQFWSCFLNWAELHWSGDTTQVCTGDLCETASFFPDVRLNYAENVLAGRQALPDSIAVTSIRAGQGRSVLTRRQLREQVESLAQALRERGLSEGDRVVAIMRNDAEAVVAALAVAALGASIASAAPEMGAEAIVERFATLAPKMLLAHARAREHDTGMPVAERVAQVAGRLPSLTLVVALDDGLFPAELSLPVLGKSALIEGAAGAVFVWQHYPFNQPLFVMASSGTTGPPKCIVHGAGGTLIEHVKEHRLHGDLRPEDRLYFQTSCAWMMWQWQLSALACCEGIVLYDGPVQDARTLWRVVSEERATVFGTSPAYLKFSQDSGVAPAREFDLSALRAVMSTGAVLYDAQYEWLRGAVGPLPLQSISGGTDIIGCFVLGNPNLPIHAGESQCRSLGLDVRSLAVAGVSGVGELICANPFPSRPLGFHGDVDGARFHASYFAANPGVWTHGDLIEFTPQGSARIHGRSDGVLNVRGIRIGPAEIYKVLREFGEVRDAMVVEQRAPAEFQEGRAVLFVVLNEGFALDGPLAVRIRRRLAQALSTAHVPDVILPAAALPYTHSGKPSEAALTAAVNGLPVRNARALRNPECLDGVAALPALRPLKTVEGDAALARQDPERYLQSVWEQAFGFAPIGLDDDFFDIGGHSLLAARLLVEVSRALGRDLPVATLLHAPTIRELAAVFRDVAWVPPALLIPLRRGKGQPFFLIHSMAGALLEMWAVLRALTDDRPVWGIQARGLEDGQEPHLRVQEMATEYLGLIREVQPQGPYSIGGYSFGGLVAFEMACQLQQAGETTDLLMLVDAQVDGRYLPARQRVGDLLRRFVERTEVFRSLDRQGQRAYLVAKGLVFVDRCRLSVGLAPRHPELVGNIVTEAEHAPALRRLRGAMRLATRAYRPRPYAGRVVFVRPEQPGANDPVPVWQRAVKGELVLETSPGDHLSIIKDANAVALARVMSRHLSGAGGAQEGA